MDPSWLTAGSSLINALTGGGKAPAGPAISGAAPISTLTDWDFSGFTATTGSGNKVSGAPNNKKDANTAGGPDTGTAGGSGAWVIGLAALAAVFMG